MLLYQRWVNFQHILREKTNKVGQLTTRHKNFSKPGKVYIFLEYTVYVYNMTLPPVLISYGRKTQKKSNLIKKYIFL